LNNYNIPLRALQAHLLCKHSEKKHFAQKRKQHATDKNGNRKSPPITDVERAAITFMTVNAAMSVNLSKATPSQENLAKGLDDVSLGQVPQSLHTIDLLDKLNNTAWKKFFPIFPIQHSFSYLGS